LKASVFFQIVIRSIILKICENIEQYPFSIDIDAIKP